MKIVRAKDYEGMSRKAANLISAQIILKPDSVLGLATGNSPIGVYRQLVEWYRKGDLDFSEISTVNLDEYYGLSKTDIHSYAYFMEENLFTKTNILAENTHIPNGLNLDELAECANYNQLIQALGGIDLQLLGIGHNGHIGFNEPNEAFEKQTHCVKLTERTIKANASFFATQEDVPKKAYTMGMKSIMNAKKIVLIAHGESKAEILAQAFTGKIAPEVPASILQLHQDVTIIADEEALELLQKRQ